MRFGWTVGVTVVVAMLVAGTGRFVTATSGDDDEISAERLGDGDESMWDMLSPAERAAVERSGVDWVEARRAPEDGETVSTKSEESFGKKMDKAGKVGFSILAVSLSLAAAAAPFLLF